MLNNRSFMLGLVRLDAPGVLHHVIIRGMQDMEGGLSLQVLGIFKEPSNHGMTMYNKRPFSGK